MSNWYLVFIFITRFVDGTTKSPPQTYNFAVPINENNARIKCSNSTEETEKRVWSSYYIYDNANQTEKVIRLYGDKLCQKGFCKHPQDLSVKRVYDSITDQTKRLLFIQNKTRSGNFYMQIYKNGSEAFDVNDNPMAFSLVEPPPYIKTDHYYRGFTYSQSLIGANASVLSELIVKMLTHPNNAQQAALFKNRCRYPYNVYGITAEAYASVEQFYDYYMVHIHCSQTKEDFLSLIVSADRYCQLHGENETLKFVGLLDLQQDNEDVTPVYELWQATKEDDPTFRNDDNGSGQLRHSIFTGFSSKLNVNNLLFTTCIIFVALMYIKTPSLKYLYLL